jgi:hypothetical protein
MGKHLILDCLGVENVNINSLLLENLSIKRFQIFENLLKIKMIERATG